MWYVTHVRDLRFKQRTSARTKRANTRNGFITGISTDTNDMLCSVTLQQKPTSSTPQNVGFLCQTVYDQIRKTFTRCTLRLRNLDESSREGEPLRNDIGTHAEMGNETAS